MKAEIDVAVVGAGPSGCATALHLARRGHSVLLLDQAQFPRDKVCGEGLMPHGVEELARLGLLDEVAARAMPFSGIGYHLDELTAIGRFPPVNGRRGGLGMRRLVLDQIFLEACEAQPGIEVRTQTRVRSVAIGADGVRLALDEGGVGARALVAADGLASPIRKQLGLEGRAAGVQRYGARLHLRLAPGRAAGDLVDVWVGPRYELYVTAVGPAELNVTVLCDKTVTRTFDGDLLGGMLRLVSAVPRLAERLDGAEPVSRARLCGPLRRATTSVVADRAVLVGDAAGFVDAITGEGMSLALASSRMAAETLSGALRAERLEAGDLRPYEDARRIFARDLIRLTDMVLFGLRHPRLARRVVRNLGRHPDAFGRMLAVNAGSEPLSAIGIRDWSRIALGL